LVGLVEHTCSLSEEITFGENRHCYPMPGGAFDRELTAPLRQEEEAVASLVLGCDDRTFGHEYRAQSSGYRPQHAVRQGIKNCGSLEHREARRDL
jgi:hypothetical protein